MDIHFYIDNIEHTKSVVVADSSYRYQEVMGDHSVTLNFSLVEYFVFPVGSWILYENVKYRLFDEADNTTKQNERQFDYTLVFKDPTAWMTRFKMRNMVDGRLAFTLTAQPFEFIDHICNNLNARSTGVVWRTGDCIVSAEKTQTFSHNTIADALNSVAQLFETEWEVKLSGVDAQTGKQIYDINLKKVEYNKLTATSNAAQRLEYGKGNGLLPGITKTKGEGNAVDVVWVEGGDRNIDSQTYCYEKALSGVGLQKFHMNKLRLPRGGQFYYIPPVTDTSKGEVYTTTEIRDMFPDEHAGEIHGWIVSNNVQIYFTDEDGFGLHREQSEYVNNGYEESLELTDIYPCLKLNITEAILEGYNDGKGDSPNPEKYSNRFWDIRAIDNPVNYNDYMIGGEQSTIVFNTGMLAGKEFNLANVGTEENPKIYIPEAHEFHIQPTEIDGITMPDLPIDIRDKEQKSGTGYIPAIGDEFAVFHVSLPSFYIEKAEKELLLEACYYLYQHGEIEVQFSCSLDGIFSRNKWETMRQYFVVGGYINFVDNNFCQDGRLLRILAIKDYINRPHAPELTLSNSTVSQSVSSELKKISQNQVYSQTLYSTAVSFSKRGFKDAQETQKKIAEAYSDEVQHVSDTLSEQLQQVITDLGITQSYFSESINPATIHTMSLLVGDKNLQFAFGHATADGTNKVTGWRRYSYEPHWTSGGLVCPAVVSADGSEYEAHVRHDYWTLNKDDNEIAEDSVLNHPYWIVNEAVLTQDGDGVDLDPDKSYFLYLQCPSGAATANGFGYLMHYATFRLYEMTHPHTQDDFYLMVGILNAEFGGTRTYADVYGSVEINGNQMRVDKVISSDGSTYFDLVNNIIAGRINFTDGLISSRVWVGSNENTAIAGLGGQFNDRNIVLWAGKHDDNYRFVLYDNGDMIFSTPDNDSLLAIFPDAGVINLRQLNSSIVAATRIVSTTIDTNQIQCSGTITGKLRTKVPLANNAIATETALMALMWSGEIIYVEVNNNYGHNSFYRAFVNSSTFFDITVGRVGEGQASVVFNFPFKRAGDYFVTVQGNAHSMRDAAFISIQDKDAQHFIADIADDSGRGDFSFFCQIWGKTE